MAALRILLKLVFAPVVLALTICVSFCAFVLALSSAVLSVLSGLLGIVALLVLFVDSVPNGIALLVMAWLISPAGLPLAAERLLGLIGRLRSAIRERVFG